MYDTYFSSRFATEFQDYIHLTDAYESWKTRDLMLAPVQEEFYNKIHNFYTRKLDEFCQALASCGHYSLIVNHIFDIFLNPENHDLSKIKLLLENIHVSDAVFVKDMCVDFYNMIKHNKEKDSVIDPFLLERGGHQSDRSEVSAIHSHIIANALGVSYEAPLKLDDLYGTERFDYNGKKLSPTIVDQVAESCRDHFGDDYGRKLPGVLRPFSQAARESCNFDALFYILDKYVLDEFLKVPWQQVSDPAVHIMAYLFDDYMQCLNSFVFTREFRYSQLFFNSKSSDASIISDLTNKAIAYQELTDPRKHEYVNISHRLSEIYNRAQRVCKEVMTESNYSCTMFNILSGLFSSDDISSASTFIIKHYNNVGDFYRRHFEMQAMLIRCTLNNTDLYVANTLHGYYSDELSRVSRDYDHHYNVLNEILMFLLKLRFHMMDVEESEPWRKPGVYEPILEYDSFFSRTEFDCMNLLVNKTKLDVFPLTYLLQIIQAFSGYPGEINLSLLNIRVEGDDKVILPDARGFWVEACGYENQLKEMISFSESLRLFSARQSISSMIANRISTLIDSNIDEYKNKLSELKESLSKETEPDSRKQLQEQIDGCLSWLSQRANTIALENPSLINGLYKRLESFRNQHQDAISNESLLEDLEYDDNQIRKWLITGEFLLQSYSFRKDTDDYSAAINPISKALELALHLAYWKMTPRKDKGDAASAAARPYLKDGQFQKDLDTGLLINLLQDRDFFGINENGELVMNKKKKQYYSCFDNWDGRNAFDIPVLKKFTDIEFKCMLSGEMICSLSMNNDNFHNRQVLYLALKYIKEKYRNPSSHTGTISKEEYDEYIDIMIGKGSLLWVLLSVIRK